MVTIAIIDDEENILNSLRRLLRKQGWEVLTFEDPQTALAELRFAEVDIIISDYRLPDMNGVELLNLLKTIVSDALRILLSGQADLAGVMGAINQAEVYRFISKPWTDSELIMTLENALKFNELEKENRRLATLVRDQEITLRKQLEELQRLERESPGITQVEWNDDGSIDLLDEEDSPS
ncbi:response regulator [Hahella ganghwensis]|uniref:response regulator n=1 Tax=Hahella ganghwensis TaxID=286420 RepID=UPI00037C8DC3|nr:response regulator [Hahella ganghwensis]